MPAGPVQPPSPEPPQDGRADARAQTPARGEDAPGQPPDTAGGECFGPLTLMRLRKDDGRSLILYGHDETQTKLGDAAALQPDRRDGAA
jgi:hypothetical protein